MHNTTCRTAGFETYIFGSIILKSVYYHKILVILFCMTGTREYAQPEGWRECIIYERPPTRPVSQEMHTGH